jgi:hypothetical protein
VLEDVDGLLRTLEELGFEVSNVLSHSLELILEVVVLSHEALILFLLSGQLLLNFESDGPLIQKASDSSLLFLDR